MQANSTQGYKKKVNEVFDGSINLPLLEKTASVLDFYTKNAPRSGGGPYKRVATLAAKTAAKGQGTSSQEKKCHRAKKPSPFTIRTIKGAMENKGAPKTSIIAAVNKLDTENRKKEQEKSSSINKEVK